MQYQATHKLGIAVSDFGRQTRARVVPVQVALGNARAAQRLVDALCVLLDRRVEELPWIVEAHSAGLCSESLDLLPDGLFRSRVLGLV